MARMKAKRERLCHSFRVTTPFNGELTPPEGRRGQSFVVTSFGVPTAETYGRHVVMTVNGRQLVNVSTTPSPFVGDGTKVLLARAVLVPPRARVALHITGTDGAALAVTVNGLYSRNVA